MKAILLMLHLAASDISAVDQQATEDLNKALYPLDHKLIMLIQKEAQRLRLRAQAPGCPIDPDFWYNLNCA